MRRSSRLSGDTAAAPLPAAAAAAAKQLPRPAAPKRSRTSLPVSPAMSPALGMARSTRSSRKASKGSPEASPQAAVDAEAEETEEEAEEETDEQKKEKEERAVAELQTYRTWDLRHICLRAGLTHSHCIDQASLARRTYEAVRRLNARERGADEAPDSMLGAAAAAAPPATTQSITETLISRAIVPSSTVFTAVTPSGNEQDDLCCELTLRLQRWGEKDASELDGGTVCMRQVVVDGHSSIFDLAQVVAASFGLYDADFNHVNGAGEKMSCRVNDVVRVGQGSAEW